MAQGEDMDRVEYSQGELVKRIVGKRGMHKEGKGRSIVRGIHTT